MRKNQRENNRGRASGGLVILINRKMKCTETKLILRSNYYLIVELTCNKITTVVGFYYMSPSLDDDLCAEILEQSLLALTIYKNSSIYILGDINCRFGNLNQIDDETFLIGNDAIPETRSTNDPVTNTRAISLNKIFEFYGFTLLNGRSRNDCPAKFTYIGKNGKSVINVGWANDYALTKITNFEISYSYCVSDHFPCIVQFKLFETETSRETSNNKSQITKYKWNTNKTNQYKHLIAQKINSFENYSLSHLIQCIDEAANTLEMKKTFTLKNNFPVRKKNLWYTTECKLKKMELRKLLRRFKRNNNDENLIEEYRVLRKEYLELLTNSKEMYENDICNKLSNTKNSATFWKTINEISPKNPSENRISLNTWQTFLHNNQTPTNNQIFEGSLRVVHCLDKDIEASEIKQSIKKLKAKKSPGNDGITNEFLINLPTSTLPILQTIFNELFANPTWHAEWNNADIKMLFKKGDKEDSLNYRPIALENTSFKAFTNLINNRITMWAENNKIFPEFQNGFRSKRGCMDCIFIFKALIDITIHQEDNNVLYAIFIDFKGAFDSVKHHILWEHLNEIGFSSKLLWLIQQIYKTANIQIVTDSGKTALVRLIIGLLQGDPMSPTLFNLFINDIESFFKAKGFRGIKVNESTDILLLGYADDLVIFSKSCIDPRDKLKALEEYCNKKHLNINTEKTKIMIFKKRISKKLYQPFKIYEKPIEIVDQFKYLGFKFHRNGNSDCEIENRITCAKQALNKLYNVVLSGRNTTWGTKTTLIRSMVESVLLYGVEVWGVENSEKVIAEHMRIFKRILLLPINTPNYALRFEIGAENIELTVTQRSGG